MALPESNSRRQHERAQFSSRPHAIITALDTDGQPARECRVRDFHAYGAGLYVENAFAQEMDIRLTYEKLGQEKNVSAKIAWCDPMTTGENGVEDKFKFRIGVIFFIETSEGDELLQLLAESSNDD